MDLYLTIQKNYFFKNDVIILLPENTLFSYIKKYKYFVQLYCIENS